MVSNNNDVLVMLPETELEGVCGGKKWYPWCSLFMKNPNHVAETDDDKKLLDGELKKTDQKVTYVLGAGAAAVATVGFVGSAAPKKVWSSLISKVKSVIK